MLVKLSPLQCRLVGALLEKEVTTPDQYPLSLNTLTLACNQKSNREPVMSLSENEVQDGIDELSALNLINDYSGFGSRVAKYKHRFCNTEFGDLQLSAQQLAIICVLFLRGPQTPGELRTRTNRLAKFDNVEHLEQVLISMQAHNGECLVSKLPREPGKRESRYTHLFSGDAPAASSFDNPPLTANENDLSNMSSYNVKSSTNNDVAARVAHLEQELSELKKEFIELKALLGED